MSDIILFRGRPLEYLTKEELIEAVKYLLDGINNSTDRLEALKKQLSEMG